MIASRIKELEESSEESLSLPVVVRSTLLLARGLVDGALQLKTDEILQCSGHNGTYRMRFKGGGIESVEGGADG